VTPNQSSPGQIAGQLLPLAKAEELLGTLESVVSAKIVADGGEIGVDLGEFGALVADEAAEEPFRMDGSPLCQGAPPSGSANLCLSPQIVTPAIAGVHEQAGFPLTRE